MANPNPAKARAARRKKRLQRAGSVEDVRLRLWEAIEAASDLVADGEKEDALRLRAVHAITQASTAYAKLTEAVEFEARLKTLEEEVGVDAS